MHKRTWKATIEMTSPTNDTRAYARRLAAQYVERGDPTGWFEPLYAAADRGETVVPWADREPNPHLVTWAESRALSGAGRTALVVGCGLGDDAEYLAGMGFEVTAFDVAPSAIEGARGRFPGSPVHYVAADLLATPDEWRAGFDLVVEIYTLQVLTGEARERAIARVSSLVAPGGTLLVIARARLDGEPTGAMPWPLTRDEIESFAGHGLDPAGIADFYDDEDPPTRRWRAEFHAAG
ncbi:class I SAM-dependent methyltransferase [Planotetraspora mira]|uniref:Methyltransferase type 12 n=1 Tax=Planotetraspora mira TaxID=58121 RepID=A0A8J3U050_9ACTN|nr:class I SAM-dependent methyltransferase [Planotetraspora mira]GII30360.1 methyltransferase type 12 [Planotetraspora mira]